VIISAGSKSVVYVKVPAEPFTWRIGITECIGVIVKEGFIPSEAIIAKDIQANKNVEG
jgi:hypothetical protein